MKKVLALGIIALFIVMNIAPSSGNMMSSDDTTPPVTTHTLDPPEPDGLNGWYKNDVTVTLNATDDISGVNHTYYNVNSGEWKIYTEPFTISEDGEDILIEYYSVDNAGNHEQHKHLSIDMDHTPPEIDLTYELEGTRPPFLFTLIANAIDFTSSMEYVEFWFNEDLQKTVVGPGPIYYYSCWFYIPCCFSVKGLIRNLEITDESVRFYAIIVFMSELPMDICAYAYDKAGNWDYDCLETSSPPFPGIYLFQNLTLPKNYEGYIGRFFIWADFKCY